MGCSPTSHQLCDVCVCPGNPVLAWKAPTNTVHWPEERKGGPKKRCLSNPVQTPALAVPVKISEMRKRHPQLTALWSVWTSAFKSSLLSHGCLNPSMEGIHVPLSTIQVIAKMVIDPSSTNHLTKLFHPKGFHVTHLDFGLARPVMSLQARYVCTSRPGVEFKQLFIEHETIIRYETGHFFGLVICCLFQDGCAMHSWSTVCTPCLKSKKPFWERKHRPESELLIDSGSPQ